MSAFLTVYTPTFRRPGLLAKCRESVLAQTVPVEHVIVEDEIGIGVDGMFAEIPLHAHLATGRYVMVLSDDNILVDRSFAHDLEGKANADVVVFKGMVEGRVLPGVWDSPPELGQIDLSNFAVEREVWQANADKWGHRYEGDFDFIHHLWSQGFTFRWWDRLVFEALKVSRGAPE